MQTEQEYLLLRYPGDRVVIVGFITKGRGSILPFGATWLREAPGWWYRPATPENIAEEVSRVNGTLSRSHGLGEPLQVELTDKASLPEFVPGRHRYRDAWRCADGKTIGVDMDHAKELHRGLLRRKRVEALTVLDRDYTRAVGQSGGVVTPEAADIETQRQRLRDVTEDSRIDSAKTLDDLRALTLEELSL